MLLAACYSAVDLAQATSDAAVDAAAAADDDDEEEDDNRESDIVDVEALRLTSQLQYMQTT